MAEIRLRPESPLHHETDQPLKHKSADYEKVLDYVSKSFTSADDQAAFDIYDSNNINRSTVSTTLVPDSGQYKPRHQAVGYNDPRANRAFFTPIVDKKRSQVAANDPSLVPAPNGSPDQSTSKYGISAFVYAKTAPTLR